jgi:integrase
VRGSKRQKATGVWELRVHISAGKYRSRTFRGSAKKADTALRALIGEVEAERARPAAGVTLGEWIEQWLARVSKVWTSPSSAKTCRAVIDNHLVGHRLHDLPLHDVTRSDVTEWVAGLKVAPSSVKRYHGVVRSALQEAVNLDLIPTNPADRVRMPKVTRREHPQIPADALAAVFAAADQQTKLLIRLATATGVRKGQLVGFRWSDFDHERGTVTVARSVARADGGVLVKETKTGSIHTMTIDADTLALVGEWRSHLEDELGAPLGDGTYLFAANVERTKPMYPDTVNARWRAVAQPAGLGHIRVHDLRHFHATTLISQGVDVVTVASRLGHKNPAVTLRVYSHPITEADQAAAATLSRFLPTD